MRILLVLLLTGCTNLYNTTLPEGMVLNERHYTDVQELQIACGAKASINACAMTDHKTYCNIHIPLAANGEVIERHRLHELSHCNGRIDTPRSVI